MSRYAYCVVDDSVSDEVAAAVDEAARAYFHATGEDAPTRVFHPSPDGRGVAHFDLDPALAAHLRRLSPQLRVHTLAGLVGFTSAPDVARRTTEGHTVH